MIHVTVCTPRRTLDNPYLSALVGSARRIGLRTAVLTHDDLPTRFFPIYKLFLVRRFLRHLGADDLVLFTDATDVCFVNGASELAFRTAFEQFDRAVVFHAEGSMYPESLDGHVPRYSGTYRYLNTGGYIGRAGALLRIFDQVLSFHRAPIARMCDQNSLWRWLARHPDGFAIDHEARIFQSAMRPQELVISEARVGNVHNDSTPLMLHFNGRKDVLDALDTSTEPELAALRAHVRARGWEAVPGRVEALPVIDAATASRGLPGGSFVHSVPFRRLDRDLADLTALMAGKRLDPLRFALKRMRM